MKTTKTKLTIFDRLSPFFTKDEAWGEPDRVSGHLLILLWHLRRAIGRPFRIHCAYEASGHAPKSQHYLGNAVDFHIAEMLFSDAIKAIEAELDVLQVADRVGLGIYLQWNSPGFHLDVRGTRARWGWLPGMVKVTYEQARQEAFRRDGVHA